MRMNIRAHSPKKLSQDFRTLPILVTLETARGLPANCQHSTTAQEWFEILDKRTDLNATILEQFREELRFSQQARITNVEMSEELLEALGFFV